MNSHTVPAVLAAAYCPPRLPLKARSLTISLIPILIINLHDQITQSMTFNNSYERVKGAPVFQEAIQKERPDACAKRVTVEGFLRH